MKLRYIFTALAAAALALVGCQEEERFLDEVQVSKSIVSLPIEGGKDTVTVTASAEWTLELPQDAWFTVNLASGAAGATQVVFEAEASSENREANIYVACAGAKQTVKVIQMAERVPAALATCKQVLDDHAAGVAVGKQYKIKGTVTDITNYGKYGCFYVNDGTGQVYVYGSMNSDQFDPAVGDVITFEGPWTSYGNFDDVTILELEKSLLTVVKVVPEGPVSLEGGRVSVTLSAKVKKFEVVIPEDAQEWISYNENDVITAGETIYIYDFILAANPAGARGTTVTFKAEVDGIEYSAAFDVDQLGAIAEVTVKDFLAAAEGDALYKLTGKVSKLQAGDYGNFNLVDATGSVYVYGLTATPVEKNDKSFPTLGIKEGDVVTLIGKRASHNGTPQVGGPAYYVSHIGHTESTVADFLKASVAADKWYKLTGKVSNIVKDKNDATIDSPYGNFDLTDETGTVYVYGLTVAPVAKNDQSFPTLGIKEGDTVTLIGTRAEFKGTAQVGGPAYYISHVAGEGGEGGEEPEVPAAPESKGKKTVEEFIAAADKDNYYELTGTVSNFNSTYCSFDLTDASGTIYVYSVLDASKTEWTDKIKDGGTITLYGKYDYYEKSSKHEVVAAHIVSFTEGTTEPEEPGTATTLTLTNAEILKYMTANDSSYSEYTIESASGLWTVNACRNKANTFLQCRGKKGGYIKTPEFANDIKSVTIHFTTAKSVYADNVYCAFPATWVAPTADAAYPEDGNVGRAVTDGSYSLTIPVESGNKQVYISIIGTYAYYLDHIDVNF